MPLNDARFYFRKRYFVIGLSFVGYLILFILRISVSVCLVDMTSTKTIVTTNSTYIQEAEYNWTALQKGIILSAFSWGYLITPATVVVVNKFGAANMFGLAMCMTGFLTIISPTLIQAGIHIYIIGRFIEGVLQGVAVSASYKIFANWIPPQERSKLINFVALGVPIGTMLGYPLSGYISHLMSWKFVFYIIGFIAVIWSLLWICTVRSSPSSDVMITEKEKLYLKAVNEISHKKTENVWKLMLTSKSVLAFLNECFEQSWSVSFIMYCLPLFIKDVHDVRIDEIAIFASLPQACDIVSRILGCWYQDYLRRKRTMSRTKIHKIFITFGQVSAVICFVLLGLADDFYKCLVILCLLKICYSLAELSYWVLPVEMALQHSATLESLVITSVSLGYFLNPLIMSFIVSNHTQTEWNHYFWFLCIFNLWGLFIFSRYGSAEPLSWANTEETSTDENNSEDHKNDTIPLNL